MLDQLRKGVVENAVEGTPVAASFTLCPPNNSFDARSDPWDAPMMRMFFAGMTTCSVSVVQNGRVWAVPSGRHAIGLAALVQLGLAQPSRG